MINVSELETVLDKDGVVFLSYGGFLTQSLIVGMTEALEMESDSSGLSMSASVNILTIFIELSQNIMHYSKAAKKDQHDPKGVVLVGKNSDDAYYVFSQNLIRLEDKEPLEKKLQEIINTDKAGIKKLYKEARRSGKNTHENGGGIGFYEVAKRCEHIEFEFSEIGEELLSFKFKAQL
mgnify:CR=1 FL=1